MNTVQHAIFPGIVAAVAAVVVITSMIATPLTVVEAAAIHTATPAAQASVVKVQPTPKPTQAANKAAAASASDSKACSLGSSYPAAVRQWCSLMEKYASQEGLDPRLIAAVMLMESGGNPKAYSRSGAVGLMQVMPRDGLAAQFQCPNGPCFANRPSSAELYDPEFNLRYAAGMLAGLVKKRGSVREALFAYGPMDVGYSYADRVLAIFQNYK